MYEVAYMIIAKIEQLLLTIKPLAGTALAEYMLEQRLYSNLNMTWFWIFIFVGAISLTLIGIGISLRLRGDYKVTKIGNRYLVGGITSLCISIVTVIPCYVAAQVNIIHAKTAVLQLLKMVF